MAIVDLEGEEWRPVPGWEAFYAVSSMGRVKTLAGAVKYYDATSRSRIFPRPMREKLMCPGVTHGYSHVGLKFYGQLERRQVHRLLLESFVGPCPDGMEGCHNDGNPRNNRLENLRWDTHSGNMRDLVAHGNHRYANRTHCDQGHPLSGDNLIVRSSDNGARRCRVCKNEGAQVVKRRKAEAQGREVGLHSRDKTHCPQGHPYAGENLKVASNGGRLCRTCMREHSARREQRLKAAKTAAQSVPEMA